MWLGFDSARHRAAWFLAGTKTNWKLLNHPPSKEAQKPQNEEFKTVPPYLPLATPSCSPLLKKYLHQRSFCLYVKTRGTNTAIFIAIITRFCQSVNHCKSKCHLRYPRRNCISVKCTVTYLFSAFNWVFGAVNKVKMFMVLG